MSDVRGGVEMRATNKNGNVTVQYDLDGDNSGSAKEASAALSQTGHGRTIDSQTRIRRLFGFAQIFAFSLTFMSTWEGMCTNMWFVLYNGGPQTFAWSILIVYCGALAQSASLAEMASIQPIAGAQYHWTYFFAPPRWKRFITWMQGWLTWFGWVSLLAGIANITAIILQSLVSLNNPNYVAERWHVTLIIFAMLFVQGLMNMYTFWLIPWIELVAGVGHICLFVVFVVVLVTLGPRHSAHYIFLESSTSSGWSNKFISWNLVVLTCAWSFTGFDGALHMSEEVRKAKQAVPRALFWTIALNGVLAYAMVIVILTSMGSIDDALNSTFPIIVIVQEVTGSVKATTAMISGLFIISFSVNLASIASVSRLTWAWSRDGGLPSWFSVVSAKRHVPERAVWLAVVVVGLLALLNIASTAAFGAITALSSLALYFSYMIAISCMVFARFQPGGVELGGWNLGRYGLAINTFALVYTAWVMVFFPFPETLPVTGVNMNYCGPIFLAVVLFATTLWFARARKHWDGPNVEVVKYVIAQG